MPHDVMDRQPGLLIAGRWDEAAGGGRFDVTDPATGEVVDSVPDGGPDDVSRAVDAAAGALASWRELPAIERGRVLRRAADLMRGQGEEIATTITREQGKPLAESRAELEYAAGFFEWFAGEAERVYGSVVPPLRAGKRVLVLQQPVGVAAAITPWNFPAAMLTRKLGPAMAAGCTSVVKPASATPLTAVAVCRILEEAGAPAGVVNLVTSRRASAVSSVLMRDSRVRKISFTGSTEVGKELIRAGADQVKRLSLELGGHAPFIVFADADVEDAVDQLLAAKFRNAGQSCIGVNRIYVQREVYDDVLARLAERAEKLTLGHGLVDGVAIGSLIDPAAVAKVHEHVTDALVRGAVCVTGGSPVVDGGRAAGSFYAPTVLGGISPEMLMSHEETFGPVAGLTPFDTEDEAIELANASVYGLAAYFCTRDYGRLLRVADRLDYGVIGVNDGLPSAPNAPFGGLKESGLGREGGAAGIHEYLDVKYVSLGGVQP
jgi:succinate-semialdehyde dehydrogenase/glutarate-semialdehyde dehydrogenase